MLVFIANAFVQSNLFLPNSDITNSGSPPPASGHDLSNSDVQFLSEAEPVSNGNVLFFTDGDPASNDFLLSDYLFVDCSDTENSS